MLSKRPPSKAAAQALLRDHGFHDPPRAAAAIGHLYSNELQRANLARIFPRLMAACEQSADPDRALVNFGRLISALPHPNMFYHYLQKAPDRLDLLVRVFAHSQALADTLARNAAYFHFLIAPATLRKAREKSSLRAELARLLMSIRVPAHKYDVVRRFRRRETLRIGVRDLIGLAPVEETTLELSNLADVCLQAVFEIALEILRAQTKLPPAMEKAASRFAVIGMGKLGGQELNYSSDVDVIFIYGEEGHLTPAITHHWFFTKLAGEITRAVSTTGDEGTIFRIDLRLRPEGATGPLARSLDSCENYYAEWGETWERMALVKARPVAGDPALGQEFIAMVQPFVYARYSGDVIGQMGALKERIEQEIVTHDRLTRHVKLGIGGIREIEFIVQSFQILRGARRPALRERNTLRALSALVKDEALSQPEATALADAYRFLRNVEHRLQMEMELQTHTIPDEKHALYRLARSLNFKTVEDFFKAQQAHTAAVRAVYQDVLAGAGKKEAAGGQALLSPEKLPAVLQQAGFLDGPTAVGTIERLLHGSGFVHVSSRTKELFGRLFPLLMEAAREVADPDAALARFEGFVTAYGSRGLLYEIFSRSPKLVQMLMRLGDTSKFLSDSLAQHPELFDEICRGLTLTEPKGPERMREELRGTFMAAAPADDDEAGPSAEDAARRWKRGEMLRVGIEDIMEFVDLEQLHQELTGVAEACLACALEESRQTLKLKKLPIAIIGMGKFGGRELGYGADLDVLFVGGRNASEQARAIDLAARVIEFMSRPTCEGTLFAVDPRLRPDGEKGPLVSSLEAHRDYYAKRALLWERQALVKARVVAGDAVLGRNFLQMVHEIVYARPLTSREVEEIRQMRRRIETERGDQKNPEGEFKTGPGGLVDVEFLVQTMQLRHGHDHAHLRTAHTLAALNRLTSLGFIEEEASAQLRRHYLFLRRIESVLRRAENTSVSRLPAGERDQLLLAKRLGFPSRAEFLGAYRLATKRTRQIYDRLMSPPSGK